MSDLLYCGKKLLKTAFSDTADHIILVLGDAPQQRIAHPTANDKYAPAILTYSGSKFAFQHSLLLLAKKLLHRRSFKSIEFILCSSLYPAAVSMKYRYPSRIDIQQKIPRVNIVCLKYARHSFSNFLGILQRKRNKTRTRSAHRSSQRPCALRGLYDIIHSRNQLGAIWLVQCILKGMLQKMCIAAAKRSS